MEKFRKKGASGVAAKKSGHTSPMQKKDWAKEVTLQEATDALVVHVRKGAAWSGNSLVYLNALWDAVGIVAKEEGFISDK